VDPEWLQDAVDGVPWLFALDNHYERGGQGDMLLRSLSEYLPGSAVRARRLGVRDIPACGTNHEVTKAHGLDAESLCASIREAVSR
jgi:transketolase